MSKKKRVPLEGTCKLTGLHGNYIASHILPKALTRADGLGPGLVQGGRGRLERRSSSWYDHSLVVEEGEKILAKYDDWAINFLRRHALVWSGWGPRITLSDIKKIPNTTLGIRQIEVDDVKLWKNLRLFFLSLLWRAAATNLTEFNEIQLSDDDLENLRKMVLEGNPEPMRFFPISLIQISTIGIRHNHTPVSQIKTIPAIDTTPERKETIFRFYIDGLIAHFSRNSLQENKKLSLEKLWVGEERTLTITTVEWEESLQADNLRKIMMETYQSL